MCMYLPLLEEERLDYSISFSIFLCFASASGTQHFLLQQILLAYLPQKDTWHQKNKTVHEMVMATTNHTIPD